MSKIEWSDQLRSVLDYVKHEYADQGLLLLSEPELKRIFDWAAALPELVEALEAFMETYKVDREIQEPTHVRDCWTLARSALLKAKVEAGQ